MVALTLSSPKSHIHHGLLSVPFPTYSSPSEFPAPLSTSHLSALMCVWLTSCWEARISPAVGLEFWRAEHQTLLSPPPNFAWCWATPLGMKLGTAFWVCKSASGQKGRLVLMYLNEPARCTALEKKIHLLIAFHSFHNLTNSVTCQALFGGIESSEEGTKVKVPAFNVSVLLFFPRCLLHGLSPQSLSKVLWEAVGICRCRLKAWLSLQCHGKWLYVMGQSPMLLYATWTETWGEWPGLPGVSTLNEVSSLMGRDRQGKRKSIYKIVSKKADEVIVQAWGGM